MSFNDLVTWANQPWESSAERIASYASARYKDPNDQGFRDAVAMKEGITEEVRAAAGVADPQPTRPGPSTVKVEDGELKVQPRAGKMTLIMDTGGTRGAFNSLEEELAAFNSKPLPGYTKPTGADKPA